MTSGKYIRMDVQTESISICVRNFLGKIVMECVIETKASTILQFLGHGLGFTMSAAGCNPQTVAQALGHQSARMALQFYGSVTDAVAD